MNGPPSSYIWPHLVRKAQHLYPTMCKHTASERLCTYIRPHPVRKAQHLQSTILKSTASTRLSTYKPTMHEAPHRKGLSTYKLTMHEAPHRKGLCAYKLTMHEVSHWNGHALTSDHVTLHPTVISEWPSVPDWVFLVTNQVPPFQEWHSALISDHVETNPRVTSEWLNTYIQPHPVRKALHLHSTMCKHIASKRLSVLA